MSLIKWEPFDEFDSFFNRRLPAMMPGVQVDWNVGVDVYEEGNDLVAEMSMPGFSKEEIKVSVKDGVLSVSGMHKEEKEEQDKKRNYHSRWIRRSNFSRSVTLPVAVDPKKVSAEYKGGVLKITMPKTDEQESEVEVQVKE